MKNFLHGFVFEHYHISDIPLRVAVPLLINLSINADIQIYVLKELIKGGLY